MTASSFEHKMIRRVVMYLRKSKSTVIVSICGLIFVILLVEVSKLNNARENLELQVAKMQQDGGYHSRRHLSTTLGQDTNFFNDDEQLIIYNRVPKTGSTSFAGIAYDLCNRNSFHVLHVNTTKNVHTLSIPDQIRLIQNITEWGEKKPAIYHGHFFYIDFDKLGFEHRKPVYINIVRNPLDRLLSYYYFVRYGDNFRPYLRRKKWADKQTFDECVEEDGNDCDPENLWVQIPFFCGHTFKCRVPGSRWALEQAKHNLLTKYLVVGITEELGDFIAMLEVILPRFFRGASDLYVNGERSHLRKTANKQKPKPETLAKIKESTIWKMENEFYEFAVDQFEFMKRLTFQSVDEISAKNSAVQLQNKQTFELSDGKLYVEKSSQFHYEKVRPR